MDFDEPRERLLAKLTSNGLRYFEALDIVEGMTDKEVDQALKPYIEKEMEQVRKFIK